MKNHGPLSEVDWEQQWAQFAPGFHGGLAHIDLGGATLRLKAGAGFGDFSHPTTRLVLNLMAPLIKDKTVFDIGCGSGILSIAALLLGAKQVYGIDIEAGAIKHSQENATINQVETRAVFSKDIHPEWLPKGPFVVVMNMIESEQIVAWASLHPLRAYPQRVGEGVSLTVITSGILATQKDRYLQLVKGWGWSSVGEVEKEGWMGFIFHISSKNA